MTFGWVPRAAVPGFVVVVLAACGLAACGLAGCGLAGCATKPIAIPATLTLSPNKTVSVDDFKITLTAVIGDSRCPIDVTEH